jgi:hypothetical protein
VAEGARLESVFTRKGNVGSNPTLSATQSGLQRNPAALFRKSRKNAAIPSNLALRLARRKCPAQCYTQALRPFSPEGKRAVRFQRLHQANAMRSQTDDKAKGLDFCPLSETPFGASHKPVSGPRGRDSEGFPDYFRIADHLFATGPMRLQQVRTSFASFGRVGR